MFGFTFRLLTNFQEEPNGLVSIEDLNNKFSNDFQGKENKVCRSDLGKQLKIVFPRTEKCRLKLPGKQKREWVYKGISPAAQNNTLPHDKQLRPSGDSPDIWMSIPDISSKSQNWILDVNTVTGSVPNSYNWVLTTDKERYNGVRIIRELTVFKDLSYKLTICGRKVNPSVIPVSLNSSSPDPSHLFRKLFELCGSVRLCTGFQVETDCQTYNMKGDLA